MNKGIDIELLVSDLHEDALKVAEKWCSEFLGKRIRSSLIDAREIHKLNEKFDICLIYGLSTPHFDPFSLARLLASVNTVLEEKVFL
ncbi:MAG: hypothetical protein DRJ64_02110 [Thermoprotei archaeon]|nr:MAG: hypothetical protein DRJ64_02110 [Thermoprotei archaeon]